MAELEETIVTTQLQATRNPRSCGFEAHAFYCRGETSSAIHCMQLHFVEFCVIVLDKKKDLCQVIFPQVMNPRSRPSVIVWTTAHYRNHEGRPDRDLPSEAKHLLRRYSQS